MAPSNFERSVSAEDGIGTDCLPASHNAIQFSHDLSVVEDTLYQRPLHFMVMYHLQVLSTLIMLSFIL